MGALGILATVWRFLRPILVFGITLPVWAFLAAGVWLYVDRTSAVRQAVDNAVTDLVAGEELAAANARADALQAINDEQARRLAASQRANDLFAQSLAEARTRQQETTDEIEDLLSRPVASDCTVGDDILRRLRER